MTPGAEHLTHEVVVVGAGPAGSVVARRLRSWGLDVALVGSASRSAFEGVSEKARALLAEEGIETEGALIEGPLPREGLWSGRRVEGREWLVDRAQLAAALRARARASGVHVREGLALAMSRGPGAWHIHLRSGEMLAAPHLVDARGRGAHAGGRLRTGAAPAERGPLLLAYGQRYRPLGPHRPETRIEAADFGWCWWARNERTLWVQVVGQPHRGDPRGWIGAAAEQVRALACALHGARLEGKPRASGAHACLGAVRDEPGLWRAGDAAVALDPLSGQGIYQALASARLIATAIRSVLSGTDPTLARRFVADWHRQVFERTLRIAAGLYRENSARGEFWSESCARYEAQLHGERGAMGSARIERRPVLIDERIVERDVLVSAGYPRGVWHVSGVPIAPLLRYFEANAGATLESAANSLEKTPRAVAAAVDWLKQQGPLPRQLTPTD